MGVKRVGVNLRLRLSPSQVVPVEKWIARFCAAERNWIDYPWLKGNLLTISAISFPFFMAYVDLAESNEFDIKRLRVSGKSEIEKLLGQQSSVTAQGYCLQALENLEIIQTGEFLHEVPALFSEGRDQVL